MKNEFIEAAAKSAPPAAVSGLSLFGVALSEWVYILTIVWIVYQFACAVWDRFKRKKDGSD